MAIASFISRLGDATDDCLALSLSHSPILSFALPLSPCERRLLMSLRIYDVTSLPLGDSKASVRVCGGRWAPTPGLTCRVCRRAPLCANASTAALCPQWY